MSSASTARGSTRTLPANAGLALTGDLAGKIAAFAGVVICARLLPVREFAHLGIAIAAVTVFAGVVDSGFSTLIVRDGAQSSADPMALLRSSLPIRVPLAALVLGTAIGGALYLGDLWLGMATAFAATGSALSLTVSALFRARAGSRSRGDPEMCRCRDDARGCCDHCSRVLASGRRRLGYGRRVLVEPRPTLALRPAAFSPAAGDKSSLGRHPSGSSIRPDGARDASVLPPRHLRARSHQQPVCDRELHDRQHDCLRAPHRPECDHDGAPAAAQR